MSKRRFAYIKKAKESVTPTPTPQLNWDIPLSNFYRSIYELPLSVFENCLLNDSPAQLAISGSPTPKQLSESWNNIITEYSEALGNSEYRMYLNLYKEVELLRIDFESVNILVSALRKTYSKFFCDELNKILRQTCKFNINDTNSYFAELDKCERRGKGLKIQLDLKLLEFETVKKKVNGGQGEPLDRNYFTSVLIILSKHNNYRITKDIFVNEYCEYVKQFTAFCDEMNKKK